MTTGRDFLGFCCGAAVVLLSHLVNAQESVRAEGVDVGMPSHFSALAQLRADADSVYIREKAACYQQFAVNSCLIKARQKHSAVSADIKRQEVALHDAERQRNAAVQLEKQAEKLNPQSQQAAIEQREKRAADAREKQTAAAAKASEKSKLPVTTQIRQREYIQKEAQKTRDRTAKSAQNQDTVPKTIGFAQKQKDAAAHQADVEKNRRERTKPLSVPLPVDGAASTPLVPRLAVP